MWLSDQLSARAMKDTKSIDMVGGRSPGGLGASIHRIAAEDYRVAVLYGSWWPLIGLVDPVMLAPVLKGQRRNLERGEVPIFAPGDDV